MPEEGSTSGMALKLNSPVGAEAIVYDWPLAKTKQYDAAGEILETMGWVCREWPELNFVMDSYLKYKTVDRKSHEEMRNLCDKFNAALAPLSRLHKGFTRPDQPSGNKASTPLLKHIIQQCYNRAVIIPEHLNHHYDAWTPETYGETTFEMVQKIIDEVKPRSKDVIVDLGSGVGQVVLQFAAAAGVKKVVGIERAKVPADYAKTIDNEFRRWMKWYGKKHRPFELHNADFMDMKFRETIKESTIIFVNNYAFGPDLDEQLKRMFAEEIPDGVRIISSKSFCAKTSGRLNQRHMTDLSAIMEVSELPSVPSPVSWTCKNVTFYLHIKDSRRLEEYYFKERVRDSSSKSSSRASSRENSVARQSSTSTLKHQPIMHQPIMHQHPVPGMIAMPPGKRGEDCVVGTTTRRQYQVWVESKDKKSSKSPSRKIGDKRMKEEFRERASSNASSASSSEPGESSGGSTKSASHKLKIRPKIPEVLVERGRAASISATGAPPRPKLGRPRKSAENRAREAKRKYRRQRLSKGRGRFRDSLELLHQHTLQSQHSDKNNESSEPSSDNAVHVSSLPARDDSSDRIVAGTHNHPLRHSKYPQLDSFLETMRLQYEDMLDRMQNEDFKQAVLMQIENEKIKRDELISRSDALRRQVTFLQEEGVKLLKMRMNDLGIEAETSGDLLNQAKEVVMKQKQLHAQRSVLKLEVSQLEQQNDQLQALCRIKDEHTIKSGLPQSFGVPSHLTSPESVKQYLLREIGQQLSNRKQLRSKYSQLETEVCLLQQEVPMIGGDTNGHRSSSDINTTLTGAKQKRGRQKSVRGSSGPRNKKGAGVVVSASKSQERVAVGQDPLKQEEIERQIQDIVQKALSVDSAAKTAEKERKQKNLERKKAARTAPTSKSPAKNQQSVDVNVNCTQGLNVQQNEQSCSAIADLSLGPLATFSSPGLVPVFLPTSTATTLPKCEPPQDPRPQSPRAASATTSDTESAPSEPTCTPMDMDITHSESACTPTPIDVDIKPNIQAFAQSVIVRRQPALVGGERPSSLPSAGGRSGGAFTIANLVGQSQTRPGSEGLGYPRVQSAQPGIARQD